MALAVPSDLSSNPYGVPSPRRFSEIQRPTTASWASGRAKAATADTAVHAAARSAILRPICRVSELNNDCRKHEQKSEG